MRVKAPVYKAPPPVAAFNWTGCYFGGNVGGGWARKHLVDRDGSFFVGINPFDAGTHKPGGFVGGGQIGCDYQTGAWVFGLQGLFDGTSLKGSEPLPGYPNVSFQTRISWFATLTGRIGYAVQPATLVYLKGGAAWVRDEHDYNVIPVNVGQPPYHAAAEVTRSGWTIGGGLEHLFAPNWSAFVEYNYMDFGTRGTRFTADPVTIPSGFNIDVTQDVQTVLIGINYRFGASPVVATPSTDRSHD